MLILAINTATSRTSIALLEKKSKKITHVSQKSWKSNNNEAEKLMPNIEKLLKKTKNKFIDVKKVVVIRGPGSFTGLRIGVTVANTISYLNNCTLYGIDTFKYWWGALNNIPKNCALLVFAGSWGVFTSLAPSSKPELINLDKLKQYLLKKKITSFFGDIAKDQKEKIKDLKEIKPKTNFSKTIQNILEKKIEPVKIVKPYYVKEPEITVSKKKIFN